MTRGNIPMLCPDDGITLTEEPSGIHACRRCQGRAVPRSGFASAFQDVENILVPESDPRSGAFSRSRSCPQCRRTMAPLRLGIQLCWVEWCATCGILWIEKLDDHVIQRLKRRIAVERAVREMPLEEQRVMANEMARELGEPEREKRQWQLIADLLQILSYMVRRW